MTPPATDTSDIAPAHSTETAPVSARGDFIAAVLWIVFGVAVMIASWRMDRLERQDINPYTIPGLLPGLLGIAIVFFGLLLLLRSWRAGALVAVTGVPAPRMSAATMRRFAVIVGLCVIFGVVLIGHGLPFWLAAALYVSCMIATLQYPQRKAEGQVARGITMAIVIGLCAGIAITLIFQEFFLVRLP